MNSMQTAERIADQRRHPRVPFDAMVTYELAGGHRGKAKVANLGAGGFALRTGWAIEAGVPIALLMGSEHGLARPAEFRGRVRWTRRVWSWQWQLGVELHDDEWEIHPAMEDLVCAAFRQAQEEPGPPASGPVLVRVGNGYGISAARFAAAGARR